jgi:SAM-dependent methyltransferase
MMDPDKTAIQANRTLWNALTDAHFRSAFYDVDSFIAGRNSLTLMERELLGDLQGKEILHLQCHFGQDTLSMARTGANVTGLDISDVAIAKAKELTLKCGLQADWVCADVLEHQPDLDGRFHIVYSSFGTIGWLPEVRTWAKNIAKYLRSGGEFIFVEFHPVIWMFDDRFQEIVHSYFNKRPIVELQKGSYAAPDAPIELPSHGWNHSLHEVIGALIENGLRLVHFREYDGSPHDVFPNSTRGKDGLFRLSNIKGELPMVYSLKCTKP